MPTRFLRLVYSRPLEESWRRLDPIAVEAALNGHRPYRELPVPEAAEVLRILRRRGYRLRHVAWLLDVNPHEIAVAYFAVSETR